MSKMLTKIASPIFVLPKQFYAGSVRVFSKPNHPVRFALWYILCTVISAVVGRNKVLVAIRTTKFLVQAVQAAFENFYLL